MKRPLRPIFLEALQHVELLSRIVFASFVRQPIELSTQACLTLVLLLTASPWALSGQSVSVPKNTSTSQVSGTEEASLQERFERELTEVFRTGASQQLERVLMKFSGKPLITDNMFRISYLGSSSKFNSSDIIHLYLKYFSFRNEVLLREIRNSLYRNDLFAAEALFQKLSPKLTEVEIRNAEGGPLFEAMRWGQMSFFLKLLKDSRFHLGQTNFEGHGLLVQATRLQKNKFIEFILEQPDYKINLGENLLKRSLLHEAAMSGSPQTFQLIYESGLNLDINAVDANGLTPFGYAVKQGAPDLIEYMLAQEELDIEVQFFNGLGSEIINPDQTPLHLAANPRTSRPLEVLLESGRFDVDLKNDLGWSPLVFALTRARLVTAQALVERGASMDFIETKVLDDLFHHIFKNSSFRSLQFLIRLPLEERTLIKLKIRLIQAISIEIRKNYESLREAENNSARTLRDKIIHLEAIRVEVQESRGSVEQAHSTDWN